MSAIFVSHSSRDNVTADEIAAWLRSERHESFFLDFDPELGIPAGRSWEKELYSKLRSCRAVIVLCSRHSMASRRCFAEVARARALGKVLLPVRIDDCTVDGLLASQQVTDLTADKETGFERLRRGLLAAGVDPSDVFEWDGRRPPYPGFAGVRRAGRRTVLRSAGRDRGRTRPTEPRAPPRFRGKRDRGRAVGLREVVVGARRTRSPAAQGRRAMAGRRPVPSRPRSGDRAGGRVVPNVHRYRHVEGPRRDRR